MSKLALFGIPWPLTRTLMMGVWCCCFFFACDVYILRA